VLLKMSFINKTRLTLSYLTEDGYLLLIVFNKERGRRALILVNNYLLNIKEIKRKTVLFIIVPEPLFITEN
jgi:hypothetical protein